MTSWQHVATRYPLDAARGIIFGLAFGLVLWVIAAALAYIVWVLA